MLRQLARLTRPVPVAGDALAIAVYGSGDGATVVAKESGFEGVACVDDAARLLDVLCDVWARTKRPWAERWARGVLEFVLWMQEPDGRWINFIYDWDGERNEHGITSATGESFWHARALGGGGPGGPGARAPRPAPATPSSPGWITRSRSPHRPTSERSTS